MDKLMVEDKIVRAPKDSAMDINVSSSDRALELKVSSAPPKSCAGSTFQGHVINIYFQDDIIPALKALLMDTRVAQAEHGKN